MLRRFFNVSLIKWLAASLVLALAACGGRAGEATPEGEAFVPGEEIPEGAPIAATVNGQPITVRAYERELARHKAGIAALGWEPATDGTLEAQVLDLLIEYELIQQEAQEQGIIVTADQIEAEVVASVDAIGSQQEFDAWLAANQWTLDEFKEQVLIDLLSSQLTVSVLASVPNEVEQVHARHILVDSQEEAQSIIDQLNAGADFTQLAADFSRDATTRYNGGDLGWFPRGALLVTDVEEAAFSMQSGETSGVVPSSQGYHVIQTLEQAESRPVPEEIMSRLQARALDEWRQSLKEGATIERFIEVASS